MKPQLIDVAQNVSKLTAGPHNGNEIKMMCAQDKHFVLPMLSFALLIQPIITVSYQLGYTHMFCIFACQ